MAKKQMLFKTKGMNQDMSVSAFNPEFSFENMNLRLSTNEGNTLLSWVNEKGTKTIKLYTKNVGQNNNITFIESYLYGSPLGIAVLNHKLIVFTHDTNKDYIYSIEVNTDAAYYENYPFLLTTLYDGNLGFNLEYPLETLVSYETSTIQKVYWTDNYNQPRVINIASEPRIYTGGDVDTKYDFLHSIAVSNPLNVVKTYGGGGVFAPGVIQYCYTYFNKNGQQTNVVDVSPLFYLSHEGRGASPEENISCVFTINLSNIDTAFEFVRLYSIQRTSLNADAIVKIVADISIADLENASITYTDSGASSISVDPNELLFIGGREIKALTMTSKDGTLFLGNITQTHVSVESLQDYITEKVDKGEIEVSFKRDTSFDGLKTFPVGDTNTIYSYTNSLRYNQRKLTTFKGGETYRFGFQLQTGTGEWSDPIFIEDKQNTLYPQTDVNDDYFHLPYAESTFTLPEGYSDYKKIRPVIVFPSMVDRSILCQGVLNPTVFNIEDRKNKAPFSQASWYFRPYGIKETPSVADKTQPPVFGLARFKHYDSLYTHSEQYNSHHSCALNLTAFYNACDVEIQGSQKIYNSVFDSEIVNPDSNSQFFVDQSIVTLNSPDIDFDTNLQTFDLSEVKLRVIGYIPISSTVSAHSLTVSTGKLRSGESIILGNGDDEWEMPESYKQYGIGEKTINVSMRIDEAGTRGTRMIAANLWNDSVILSGGQIIYQINDNDYFHRFPGIHGVRECDRFIKRAGGGAHPHLVNFFVHPWQRKGPLNNDPRSEGYSTLNNKKESNLLYSLKTNYIQSSINFEHLSADIHLQEDETVHKMLLSKQKRTSSAVSYYPNIDKVLTNSEGYKTLSESITNLDAGDRYDLDYVHDPTNDTYFSLLENVYNPVEVKYKSTSHVVIALKASDLEDATKKIPIMPYGNYNGTELGKFTNGSGTTFWGDTNMEFEQQSINVNTPNFLWIGELYKEVIPGSRFGGTSKEALRNNSWLIGGDTVDIPANREVTLKWTEGDTFYQRYDCLKTYPFTTDDTNQLVEILSFMCETHVNIDGRYDNNRGQTDNTNMSPQNFNLLNYVYSQRNNFFTNRIVNYDIKEGGIKYPNLITFTKTKTSGADVDLWTNITLANSLELDGDKGQITSLRRFNDQIIAFQDSAIAQVLYNENVQISSTQGVPIEIANSGKVDGKRYLTDSIGCSNKWAMTQTPKGIYFMDSYNKGICLFNGQITNLTDNLGFNTWAKRNIPAGNIYWSPGDGNFKNFVAYYDKLNQDVLFIGKDSALAFSEKLGTFTSFYDYENTPYLCCLDDIGIWIRNPYSYENTEEETVSVPCKLWQHQAGDYCRFFGTLKPYWMTLVGNPEPQMDKTFTNLEFRASVEGDGELNQETGKFTFSLPFDSLETWNEYQHGLAKLDIKNGHAAMKHHTLDNKASLKRKFRIWRCDIPRDNANYDFDADAAMGIYRTGKHPMDRMRNPWLYIKLYKSEAGYRTNLRRTEIHDVVMTYFD